MRARPPRPTKERKRSFDDGCSHWRRRLPLAPTEPAAKMAAVSLDGAFGLSASEMWKRRGGGSRRAKAASRGQEKCDLTRLGTAKCGMSARAETPRGGRERRRQKRHSHRGRRGWWGGSGARWPRTAAGRASAAGSARAAAPSGALLAGGKVRCPPSCLPHSRASGPSHRLAQDRARAVVL